MTTLREAIEQTVAILGPEAPLCSGCVEEWTEALRILRAALAEQPAEQEPKTQGWQPIETAPKGRVLLVYYKNSLGNGRTMRARHYLPETLESDTTESGWADEGWYEESEAYEYLMPLEHDPTHWMPLPAGPDTAPQPAKPAGQEPVAYMLPRDGDDCAIFREPSSFATRYSPKGWTPLYTAPQPAKREPLTDEEVLKIWSPEPSRPVMGKNKVLTFARAIERAHGIGEQE